jgi:uncharacterized protein YkwD
VAAVTAAGLPAAATGMPRTDDAATAHAAGGCSSASARASDASQSTLRSALMCLVNKERAEHGLKPLRQNHRLRRAATRHARDMVRHRYFEHQRSGGPDLGERLRRAGWRGRAAGETLAYGCGSKSTPRVAVRAWMNSPGHREIVLSGQYGQGGPAVAKGTPAGCGGATWVLDVGSR